MGALEIPATETTLAAAFNYEKGELHMSGRSLDRHADLFFEPLINWVDEYITQPRPQTTIHLCLEYSNTSTSLCLFSILKKLKMLDGNGTSTVSVMWKYDADDEEMLECGRPYAELLGMHFEFIEEV